MLEKIDLKNLKVQNNPRNFLKMDKIDFSIKAVDRTVWSGKVEWIKAQTLSGEVQILPGHSKMLTIVSGSVQVPQKKFENLKGLLWAEKGKATLFLE